jgi:hypothetical protein
VNVKDHEVEREPGAATDAGIQTCPIPQVPLARSHLDVVRLMTATWTALTATLSVAFPRSVTGVDVRTWPGDGAVNVPLGDVVSSAAEAGTPTARVVTATTRTTSRRERRITLTSRGSNVVRAYQPPGPEGPGGDGPCSSHSGGASGPVART